MAYEFKLPDLGEGVVEGEIVKWLVAEGDTVSEDQPLVEVMTDKATVSIPSPQAGKVSEIRGAEGDVVEVGQTMIVIDTGAGGAKAAPAKPAPAPAAARPAPKAPAKPAAPKPAAQAKAAPRAASGAPARNGAQRPTAGDADVETRPTAAQPDTPPARLVHGLPARSTSPLAGQIQPSPSRRPSAASSGGRVLASPSVRRRAREMGVDLATLSGSGEAGRVTAADLERAANGSAARVQAPARAEVVAPAAARPRPPYNLPPGALAPPPGGENRIPLRGLRKRIAEKMQQSKNTAAHFTFVEEVDMRKLVKLREELKGPAADDGVKLTYLPFFVKAATIALARHPQLNITLDEATQEIVYRGYYNIGMAVATDRGLIAPVVKDTDQRSILDIAREIDRLAHAARDGSLTVDDLQHGTFTITSLGLKGGLFATPVINFPEVAIMGIHQIKDTPIVENGEIVAGKVMLLSLSFDHRLVDGHVGAAFAYEVIGLLENPERMFMELS